MSTEFNFPANPVLDEIVILPDGGQAQWNGYAWVTLGSGSSVDYPITIEKGGTNATTLSDAQLNLIIGLTNIDTTAPATPKYGDRWIRPDNMTEQVWVPNAAGTSGVWINPAGGGGGGGGGIRLLEDGTVDAPGLAWASEPGLGWFRPVAKTIATVADGYIINAITGSDTGTTMSLYSPINAGISGLNISNNIAISPDYQILGLSSDPARYVIGEILNGTAVSKPLILNFPSGVEMLSGQLRVQDGTLSEPGFSFVDQPDLGLFRVARNWLAVTTNGHGLFSFFSDSGSSTFGIAPPIDNGTSQIYLQNQNDVSANFNFISMSIQGDTNSIIYTGANGTATRGNLTIDSANIYYNSSSHNFNGSIFTSSAITAGGAIVSTEGNILIRSPGGYATLQLDLPGDLSNKYIRTSPQNNLEFVNSNNTAIITIMDDAGNWSGLSFTPTSDERMKSNIEVLEPAHESFSKIQPISFVRNQDPESGKHWGFSSQNLYENVPAVVVGEPTAIREDGTPNPACIDPVGILAMTVLEIQSILKRLQTLENK
jgi:Chaperone of endosialidase